MLAATSTATQAASGVNVGSELSCPHRPPCPGCPRFGRTGIAAKAERALAELAASYQLPAPQVLEGNALGFRQRARLAIRGRAHAPKIGLFREGTHQVVDIPNCVIHHPLINELAREIKAELKGLGVAPYSDQAHAGLVRYLQVVVERASGKAQVVLVTNADHFAPHADLFARLGQRLGERVQGLFWNGNPERSNAILGSHWQHVQGQPTTVEVLGGARVFFPPGAFGQSHLDLYERIVARVHQWVGGASRVLELYAGTGGLGLGLALKGALVQFNEIESDSLSGLRLGIAALPAEARRRVGVAAGNAGELADALCQQNPDVVLADPPRKGLDAGVIGALVDHRPARFVYLSCGLESFLRDAAELRRGDYRLSALEAYALFPFSEHVESLALFEGPSR